MQEDEEVESLDEESSLWNQQLQLTKLAGMEATLKATPFSIQRPKPLVLGKTATEAMDDLEWKKKIAQNTKPNKRNHSLSVNPIPDGSGRIFVGFVSTKGGFLSNIRYL